jgi:tetraacyldisaccharide 4'-kinase
LNPLSSIFGLGVRARNSLYDHKILPVLRLDAPVVSVGNLSVGGSGKTPFVLLLGEALKARGIHLDVLSRGYGRQTRGVSPVDPAGAARDFGDEPLLIARRLSVPVIVGESRYEAGLFAEAKFGAQLHLLDDGFQHRNLARDFDIVLVTPEDAHGQLLPAGRLREPLTSLRRANAVVLMNNADAGAFPIANQEVWRTRRSIALSYVPSSPVVFCGIARPEGFLRQLREAGIEPVAHKFFRDHHAYTAKDVQALLELRQQNGGGGFLTTEKDVFNLGELQSALAPLSVARVRMELENQDDAVNTILRRIEGSRPRS